MSKISERVQKLAETLKAGIVFDEAGTAKLAEETFAASLPEGLTVDVVKKSQHAVLDFADAATSALGEAGLEFLKKNTDIKSVSLSGKAGIDVVNVEIERARTYRNPKDGSQGTKYGAVTASLKHGVGSGRGAFKQITGEINEKYSSVFSS